MKVKELAEIFKVPVQELLNMLSNVGVNLDKQEDTMIDAGLEKKLAKRYNVPYPFKTQAKPKPVNKVNIAVKKEEPKKEEPKKEEKPAEEPKELITIDDFAKASIEWSKQNFGIGSAVQPGQVVQPVQQPVVQQTNDIQMPRLANDAMQPQVVQQKPKQIILNKNEVVAPRVDEETLSKYADFLDDDEYNDDKTDEAISNSDDELVNITEEQTPTAASFAISSAVTQARGISIIVPTSYLRSEPAAAISASAVATTTSLTNLSSLTSPTRGIMISGTMFQSA